MSMVEIQDFSLAVNRRSGRRTILDSVSLSIDRGEAVGLVGESGSGKSVTARALLRMFPEKSAIDGDITFDGTSLLRMSRRDLLEHRRTQVAMIFQDPRAAINPVRPVGDFLVEGLRTSQGIDGAQAEKRAVALLEQVGISKASHRIRQYPHEFSGGMLQRAMIANALGSGARLILADEPTTALDVSIQSDVVLLLDELRRDNGLALLFITHDLDLATAICDRIAVMYAGSVVEDRPAHSLYNNPLHPYTSALINCRPDLDQKSKRLPVIPGAPASAFEAPPGCAFSARCAHVVDKCKVVRPDLITEQDGQVRCHRSAELADTLRSTREWAS